MFKSSKLQRSQKLEEFPDEVHAVEMNPEGADKNGYPPLGKEPPAEPSDLEGKLPLMCRVRGTVIKKIWKQILLVVIWSTAVVSTWTYVEEAHFNFKPILIQLMGVVCGLLLAFRSNSAYDRYWEGRKYWSTMTLAIRNLTRVIWINIKAENAADIVEKKSAINLLIAFAIATKHYLREEYDYDLQDLLNITHHIDWLHTPSSNQPLPQQPAHPPPETETETVVVDIATDTNSRGNKSKDGKPIKVKAPRDKSPNKQYRFKAHDIPTPTNIPLELSYYIASYINSENTFKKCDGGTVGAMNSALGSLVECLTGFERILRTPIPLAYSVHLHQSIWIYILALPFQLAPQNEWWTVLVVGITAFFLLGILAIGWEIENPFGYDDNDLPLGDFCKVLRREIEVIVSHRPMVPKDWVFKRRNRPFAPECLLDAIELSETPHQEILDMLTVRGAKISKADILNRQETGRVKTSTRRRTFKEALISGDQGPAEVETEKMLP